MSEIGIREKEYLFVKESAQFVLLGRFFKAKSESKWWVTG